MECQSEIRVPENSIRNVAIAQTLPKPQTPSVLAKSKQPQQQSPQYVINSVAMHAKATTANFITGGTLHRVKSAQVRAKVCPLDIPTYPSQVRRTKVK
ncbi:hypothetical protein M5D96_007865 [Drosophila gunungcola]|uniref:Uncharacterized protein n=1 Tax=Drosophila gunungcola TaxID=103775 RepID=A0A9P9YLX1_9MUSC|nr:hypothetical protein M5D96_007865 [Drosophila gunungcola]